MLFVGNRTTQPRPRSGSYGGPQQQLANSEAGTHTLKLSAREVAVASRRFVCSADATLAASHATFCWPAIHIICPRSADNARAGSSAPRVITPPASSTAALSPAALVAVRSLLCLKSGLLDRSAELLHLIVRRAHRQRVTRVASRAVRSAIWPRLLLRAGAPLT